MGFLKKNYMNISIIFLALAVYVILFPVISKVLISVFPTFAICPYLAMTGKPCPLCGGTSYLANLGQALKDPSYLLHPFGYMILFIGFELFFRIFCIIQIKRGKSLDKIIRFDVILHSIAVALFIFYEITFMLFQ